MQDATVTVHTNRRTGAQMQTGFIICPMLYAITMEQIKCLSNESISSSGSSKTCLHACLAANKEDNQNCSVLFTTVIQIDMQTF